MPNPNALVGRVLRFDPPLELPPRGPAPDLDITVVLEGDQRFRLDPESPTAEGYARVLDGLRRERLHVYVEVDAETSTLERLLIPHATRVLGFRTIDDGVVAVELERSHARHLLRTESPDFDEMEGRLRESLREGRPVLVVEDDAHDIVDVRFFEFGPEGPPRWFPRPETAVEPPWWRLIRELIIIVWRWPWWPWWWWRCVSASYAQQVFDQLAATSCDPLSVPPPCIPFLYPDDGCWGRAHEMCRLLIGMGLSPRKVWIQGSLYVSTANNPGCGVHWGWHVAPTLCVRGPRLSQTRQMVMDPALFETPVTQAMWKGVQGDPGATLTPSAASIFYLWGNVTDPTYTQTNQVLATYRLQLQNRSVAQGPPPYAHC